MTPPIRPEQLNKRITIQQQQQIQDGNWDDLITVWAFIDPTGGSEFYAAQKVNSEATANIWIRYRTGIESPMRVKYGTRIFYILASLNWQEANRWIRLVCKELV